MKVLTVIDDAPSGGKQVYRYTLIMSAAHGMGHAYLLFFAPFLRTIQEALGLDWVALGGLVSIAYVAYGLGALPAGIISDYIGHRRAAVVAMIVPAVGCGVGFLATSYWMMAAAFVLIGVGTSIYHPAANALVTGLAGEKRRGRALGIHGVGGNVGMLLAPVLTAGVAEVASWRWAFLLWAVIGLGVALLVSRSVPEVKARGKGAAASGPATSLTRLLTAGLLAVLAVVALQGFIIDGVFAYLPTFLQESKGLSVVLSGLVAGLNFGAGVLGQLAGGFLSDAIGRRATVFWGTVGCVLTLGALPILGGGPALLAGVFAMGFCLFVLQPPVNALVADVTPKDARGALFGLVFLAKYGVGALAPFVGGLMAASSGNLGTFFYLLAAAAAVSLIFVALIPRPGRTVGN
jgi:FSR family fosmidomycin resistance protein-like MFS transporter